MSTFVLIPGAGGASAYWHRVVPLLEAAGHEAVAVDLPGADERAGLDAYTDRVAAAIGTRTDTVLVAQSMGAFTAAMVCARMPVRALVFVNAMIPNPHETAGAWWDHTRSAEAREAAAAAHGYASEFDLETYFLHDVPKDVAQAIAKDARPEAAIAFAEECAFERWPEVPIHVLAGRDDRFFPLEFQRRVARERLGKEVDVIAGGHLVALSNPVELADRLLEYPSR